jgi:hypothetical protein
MPNPIKVCSTLADTLLDRGEGYLLAGFQLLTVNSTKLYSPTKFSSAVLISAFNQLYELAEGRR